MSAEDRLDHVKSLRDEVLRRVGRNVLLFQQVEKLLKYLLSNTNVETGLAGPTSKQRARDDVIQKLTLGKVRDQYFEAIVAEPNESANDDYGTELIIKTSFRMSPADSDRLSDDRKKFEAMTRERNDLVHHFLDRCRLEDAASLEAALVFLDEQRERALPLHGSLKQQCETLLESRRSLVEFLQSPQGVSATELMHLQSSRIVTLLAQASLMVARADGWTLLSKAGEVVAAEDPELLRTIKRCFGHPNLKALVAAAEIFELLEEATAKGGKRVLYRIRPGTVAFV
ncbi:hypothetical protein [Nevskia ramosa]|uniref:hypothetical protein n=1 Tax=Nevskia ramosa TaxID=64002 RepID=UPI003D0F7EDC